MAPGSSRCDLCGSDFGRTPKTQRFGADERRFCCTGCLNVFAILYESNELKPGADPRETELFRRSRSLGLVSQTGEDSTPCPGELRDESGTKEALFHVGGMWCASCGWLIEHALISEPAVRSAEVHFASDLVRVRYDPQQLPPGRIERRVSELGYTCVEYTGQREAANTERRDLLLRIGVAGFVWMNVMYLSLVFYVGYFEQVTDSARHIVPLILAALTGPTIGYAGWPIFRAAWIGLREKTIRMETLLAVGIFAAWFYSLVQAFLHGPHFYFDTACALVTLVLAGKVIERSARDRTARAVTLLYRLMPLKARVLHGERETFVPIEQLRPGMEFTVKAGETVPADGAIVEGTSHMDESVLTGEAAPVPRGPGQPVVCGSTNGAGVLRVRTVRSGDDTTLSRIIKMVEQAMSSRSRLERMADRISRAFVPAVIAVALLTFAGALLVEPAGQALMRAITVLVVACPCALGIATPLAVTAAVGSASRRGVLISDAGFLETVTRLDTMIFDKTGTITEGRFRLVRFSTADGSDFLRDHLPRLASVERYSEHPLGQAVVRRAAEEGIAPAEATDVRADSGFGIRGTVDGANVFLGSRSMSDVSASATPQALQNEIETWTGSGLTVSWYGWAGKVRGALGFGDSIRPSAPAVARRLKEMGIRTWVVSGDTERATSFVAAAVLVDDHRAGCLPGDKERLVRELKDRGMVVAMAGDGINDAPALAQADIGIAMGTGTDIAMRAAPVTLMSSDLGRIPEVFELARRTVRIVRQNLFWAFFYNAAGISLAVLGILNPIAAAVAMILSSLCVILNSLRLRKVR